MRNHNQIEIKKYITPPVRIRMTKWEQGFINTLYNWKGSWTDKQLEVFDNIKKKYRLEAGIVVENVLYLPMGYAAGAKINQNITSKQMRKSRGIEKQFND
jgi:hypothetical protein